MRARLSEAIREGWPWHAKIGKPSDAPPGYTGNTVVTEWLTLHCRGRWASKAMHGLLEVRFAAESDLQAARDFFNAQGLWNPEGAWWLTPRRRGAGKT